MRDVNADGADAWIDQVQNGSRMAFSGILARQRDLRGIASVAEHLFAALASASDQVAARFSCGRPYACRKGCSACCHALIQSTPLYTLTAFLHARAHCPPDALARAEARALARRRPCPFLEERACGIYPARPPVCRYYFSYNADWCQIDRCCVIDGQENAERQRHRLTARAFFAIERAAAEALAEAGLTSERHALDAGVRILLTDSSALGRWLEGEPVFAKARMSTGPRAFDWHPPLHGRGHGPEQGVIPAP